MIDNISLKFGSYISAKAGYLEKADAVSYGCEIMIRSLIKVVTISAISLMLDIFLETWTIIIFSALLRTFSGGAHCSTYKNCLLTSLLTFTALGLLIKAVNPFLTELTAMSLLILATIVLFSIWLRWIPSGSENRPLTNSADLKRFKKYSFLIIGLNFIISLVLIHFQTSWKMTYILAATLGLLWQGFNVSPFGYYVISKFDKTLNNLKGGTKHYEKVS
ncbi:accessory gene regulator B family protein [Patescibacteria group bacterium]|nr:accessory gene regulator B family protein [Patescibacteria group bacterium]